MRWKSDMEIQGISLKNNQLEEVAGITPEYPFVMHRTDMRTVHIPWHWHEEIEFGYVCSGAVRVTTVNSSYVFKKGEGYFINSNILACMENGDNSPQSIYETYLFHPVFLSGHFKSIFETRYIQPVIQDRRFDIIELKGMSSPQKNILSMLKKASSIQDEADCEFKTRNLFSEIWLELIREIRILENDKIPARLVEQDRIQTMLAYIQNHYDEHITLSDIAASAAVSERECTRCFKAAINRTPFEYLTDYRIETAEKHLKNTDDPIIDIALRCGFSNGAYFSKVFKEQRGVSPGTFRRTARDIRSEGKL